MIVSCVGYGFRIRVFGVTWWCTCIPGDTPGRQEDRNEHVFARPNGLRENKEEEVRISLLIVERRRKKMHRCTLKTNAIPGTS